MFPYTIRASVIKSTNLGISHSSSPASSSQETIDSGIDRLRAADDTDLWG